MFWGAGAWVRPPVDHGVVTQHEDQTASAVSLDPLLFQEKFDQLSAALAPLFTRREQRAHAAAYVRGLLADLPRKNCWTLSEHTGQARASGMQRLLYQAVWDEEAARDSREGRECVVRRAVIRGRYHPSPHPVTDG